MLKRYFAVFAVLLYTISFSGIPALRAENYFNTPSEEPPSVLSYTWKGLALGILGGLAAGYARYADSSNSTNEILKSIGYGSLLGIGAGLIAGLADSSAGRIDGGAIVLRDMSRGGLLGTVIGTIWGGIKAIDSTRWEDVGKGAAYGYLGGLTVGLIVGLIEWPAVTQQQITKTSASVRQSVVFLQDSRANLCPGWQVAYSF